MKVSPKTIGTRLPVITKANHTIGWWTTEVVFYWIIRRLDWIVGILVHEEIIFHPLRQSELT